MLPLVAVIYSSRRRNFSFSPQMFVTVDQMSFTYCWHARLRARGKNRCPCPVASKWGKLLKGSPHFPCPIKALLWGMPFCKNHNLGASVWKAPETKKPWTQEVAKLRMFIEFILWKVIRLHFNLELILFFGGECQKLLPQHQNQHGIRKGSQRDLYGESAKWGKKTIHPKAKEERTKFGFLVILQTFRSTVVFVKLPVCGNVDVPCWKLISGCFTSF